MGVTDKGATDNKITSITNMKDGMSGGWGQGYAIIDEVLEELQARSSL